MTAFKLVGILLIIGGTLGLVYGGFSYTKDEHHADVGPVHVELGKTEHVNVPLWAGVAAIVAGLVLLASPRKS
jgi:hypothetical protein